MNKKLAFDNRLCFERSLARQQAIHHQKLQSVVPTALSPSKIYLDSNAPTKQPHLETNPKRKQLDRERQLNIDAQNQRLARKMEHILNRQENVQLAAASVKSPRGGSDHCGGMKRSASPPRTPAPPHSPKKSVHGPARVHMPGIRLDATQTPLVDCYLSPDVALGRGTACSKRTLVNRGVQKRQQERIADENKRLKQRVQSQKPFYNTKQWDAEWQKSSLKFEHIHQNGTVGYLLPPTKTAKHTKLTMPPRTIKTQSNMAASRGLPLIHNSGHDHKLIQKGSLTGDTESSARCRPSAGASDSSTPGCYDDDESDDGDLLVVELPPCLLLEATTRKGVQIHVEELQVELISTELARQAGGCVGGDRCVVTFACVGRCL